jgi:hypothetical protein
MSSERRYGLFDLLHIVIEDFFGGCMFFERYKHPDTGRNQYQGADHTKIQGGMFFL